MSDILTTVDLKDVPGFRTAALACGLKWSGAPDLLLVVSDGPCVAAGTFTRSLTVAAPVVVSRSRVPSGRMRGLIVNAGNANACTGPQGMADARAMGDLCAKALGLPEGGESFLVASTGVIGTPLPMDKVSKGIREAAVFIQHGGGGDAAKAILTTDLVEKKAAVIGKLKDGTPFKVAGIAKGSGMIAPNMATMIAIVLTDLAVEPETLQRELSRAAERTFNRITVDGDTSTNDCCLALASGAAKNPEVRGECPAFREALEGVMAKLAQDIVRDGEGATKFVTVRVTGMTDEASAARIARTICESPLCKTAFAGADPNWGRIVAAAGRAGVSFDPERATLTIGGVRVFHHGVPVSDARKPAQAIMQEKAFEVHLEGGLGKGAVTFWTCDLTQEYIKINAFYHT